MQTSKNYIQITKPNDDLSYTNSLSTNLNLDYIDMLYREKLKFGKKDEIIIKLKWLTETRDTQKKLINPLIQ